MLFEGSDINDLKKINMNLDWIIIKTLERLSEAVVFLSIMHIQNRIKQKEVLAIFQPWGLCIISPLCNGRMNSEGRQECLLNIYFVPGINFGSYCFQFSQWNHMKYGFSLSFAHPADEDSNTNFWLALSASSRNGIWSQVLSVPYTR